MLMKISLRGEVPPTLGEGGLFAGWVGLRSCVSPIGEKHALSINASVVAF